jgi:hypothetical protein
LEIKYICNKKQCHSNLPRNAPCISIRQHVFQSLENVL